MAEQLPVLSRETVRMLDRFTIEHLGIPGIILMENAGTGCAQIIKEKLNTNKWHEPVLVLSGSGNNGGDGFVIARHLVNAGIRASTVLIGKRERIRKESDAEINLKALLSTGVTFYETQLPDQELESKIQRAGCIVDALFGTGLNRPIKKPFNKLFALINQSNLPVLAVDIPSGLDAETGEILGSAIKATITATFAAVKLGLVKSESRSTCGAIRVIPISIPYNLIQKAIKNEKDFIKEASAILGNGKD